MSENQTATEPQVIIIDDKQYQLADLTQENVDHINNLRTVENQIKHYRTTIECMGITQNTLMGALRASLADIPHTVVEKPPEAEAPSSAE